MWFVIVSYILFLLDNTLNRLSCSDCTTTGNMFFIFSIVCHFYFYLFNTICWKDFRFPIECSWHPFEIIWPCKWGIFLGSLFQLLVCMSVFMPGHTSLDDCSFVVNQEESRKGEASNFVLFQDRFGISGSLEILYEF